MAGRTRSLGTVARAAWAALGVALFLACGPRSPAPAPRRPFLQAELERAEAAVARDPRDATARRDVGLLRWMSGDLEGAGAALDVVLVERPRDPRALLAAAWMDDVAARDARARERYLRLVELSSTSHDDAWSRAAAVFAARRLAIFGEDPDAVEVFRSLRRLLSRSLPPQVKVAALATLSRAREARGPGLPEPIPAEQSGCVEAWHVTPVEATLPFADHGRSAAGAPAAPATWLPACVLRLPGGPRGARRYVLHATAPRGAAEIEARVGSHDTQLRVRAGDTVVLERDASLRFAPTTVRARAVVPPSGRLSVDIVVPPGGTTLRVNVRPSSAQVDSPASPRSFDAPAAPRFVDQVLVDALTAHDALERGDIDAAWSALDRVRAAAPRWVVAGALEARIAVEHPAWPRPIALDRARRALYQILRDDPTATRLRIALAELHALSGDDREVLALLDHEGLGHWRALWRKSLSLRAMGRDHEADAALAAAPEACPVLAERARRARYEGRTDERRFAAERLARCDGDSPELAEVAQEMGDLDLLVKERRRLLERDALSPHRAADLARAWLLVGDGAAARRVAEEALVLHPWHGGLRLVHADALLAHGDDASARRTLEDGLAHSPDDVDLVHALVAAGGSHPLAPWRVDGVDAIRRYEEETPVYETPAVVVLDRTVVRVLENGAQLRLVHNVVKVLQKDGLDRFGEIGVPPGADVLVARTVKADGTIREPETLDKEGITAPDLAVGDYVELEYVTGAPAPDAFTTLGERFYFQTLDVPLHESVLVVVAPEGGPPLAWDDVGKPPELRVEPAPPGTRVWVRRATAARVLPPEPLAPGLDEILPSTLPYAGGSLEEWMAWISERMTFARRADPAVRQLALQKKDARALYRFVLERIDGGASLVDEPSRVLAARRGSRLTLLLALLHAAEIPTEVWLARPLDRGTDAPRPPQVTEVSVPLVRAEVDGAPVWLDVRYRHAPFGFVGPDLRGALAVRVPLPGDSAGEPLRVGTVDAAAGPVDRRSVTLDVALSDDGSARFDVTEEMHGMDAVVWRAHLQETPAEEITREYEERALGFWFPGLRVGTFSVLDRDAPDRPLILRYRMEVPAFARPAGDGRLEVPLSPMPLLLGRRYVLVPARKTPLVLPAATEERTVTMTVRLPSGYDLAGELPVWEAREAPGGVLRYESSARSIPGGFTSTTVTSHLPYARVAPRDYPAFVRFAAAVDSAEARTLDVSR